MENLKFPESWEQAKSDAYFAGFAQCDEVKRWTEAARIMAESYEKRIAELEKELRNPYPDTEANGWVFCGKCGQQK